MTRFYAVVLDGERATFFAHADEDQAAEQEHVLICKGYESRAIGDIDGDACLIVYRKPAKARRHRQTPTGAEDVPSARSYSTARESTAMSPTATAGPVSPAGIAMRRANELLRRVPLQWRSTRRGDHLRAGQRPHGLPVQEKEGGRMSGGGTAPVWYCPHCSKRIIGDPRSDAILIWRGAEPRQYRLCTQCTKELQVWLEGGE